MQLKSILRLLNGFWLPVLILLLGLSFSTVIFLNQQNNARTERREAALNELHQLSARLEQQVNIRLTITLALEAFVHSQRDLNLDNADEEHLFRERFGRFTESLNKQVPGILSMQLAPDAIIRYMTNEAANRKALGHDLLVDDDRRAQVLNAIARRSLIIDGPIELLQGGNAIIARNAIFTTANHYQPEQYVAKGRGENDANWLRKIPDDFWGLATVLIDSNTLYRDAGVEEVIQGFRIAIRGRHGLGSSGDIFWGDPKVFDAPTATVPVRLSGGEWILAAQDTRSSVSLMALGMLVTFCAGSLLLAYTLWSHMARRLAETHNRAKSNFLTTMSHELRTPLNAIIGFAQLLRLDDTLTDEQHDSVEEINKAGEHLLSLINDVLDLARIEAGRLELSIQSVSLDEIMCDTVELITPSAQRHCVKVTSPQGTNIKVQADPVRLRQVLLNLLSNAVKYNRANGSVKVVIGCPEQGLIRIEVIDTGKGLSPQQQAQIFLPFHRLDRNRNEIEGTGIGLIISRNLIEKMGGRLGVDSVEGQGSRFWFEVPLESGRAGCEYPTINETINQ